MWSKLTWSIILQGKPPHCHSYFEPSISLEKLSKNHDLSNILKTYLFVRNQAILTIKWGINEGPKFPKKKKKGEKNSNMLWLTHIVPLSISFLLDSKNISSNPKHTTLKHEPMRSLSLPFKLIILFLYYFITQ